MRLAIQQEEHGDPHHADAKPLRYRIGINLGDVIIEGDDIYGEGVNVAARLQAMAPVGGIALNLPDNCESSDAAVWTGWIHGERRDTLSDPNGSVTHAYTTSVKIRVRDSRNPTEFISSSPTAAPSTASAMWGARSG